MRKGSRSGSRGWPMTRVSLTPAPSDAGMPRSVCTTAREEETGVAAFMVGSIWGRALTKQDVLTERPGPDAPDLVGAKPERMQEIRVRLGHVLLEVRVPLAHLRIGHADGAEHVRPGF